MIWRSTAPLRRARPATRRPWRLVVVGVTVPALLGAVAPAAPRLAPAATASAASPASAPAPAGGSDTVLVAARDLPRGTVLRTSDIDTLVLASGDAARSRPSSNISRAGRPDEGWVVRRLVHRGEPLRAPAVAPPPLILAGSEVSLVWELGGLRVTRAGTAIGPAHFGERVVVRVDAKRRFVGVASAPGTVTVVPP